MLNKKWSFVPIVLMLLGAGCQGKLSTSSVPADFVVEAGGGRRAGPRGGDDGTGGRGTGGESTQGTGGSTAMDRCAAAVFESSSAPLRRLTSIEYQNTIGDLFPGTEMADLETPPDARLEGFTNTAAGQSPSSLAVAQYDNSATSVAAVARANMAGWAPCSDGSESCARQAIAAIAPRIYRRPLTDEETQALDGLLDAALSMGGPDTAVEMALSALLQSPNFLYRPEFGSATGLGEGAVQLSGYEMATRLSYFLLATTPDDQLMAAARDGKLDDPAQLRIEAGRLLKDERSRPVVTDFFVQWLRLYKLEELSLDPNLFPEFGAALRQDLKDSAQAYIEHALWDLDSWSALMSGSFGYVNDRLAPLFGVAAPGTTELTYVELDPTERRGILTQPSLLSATSHGIRHSPILRGVTMLNNILCMPPPAPPVGILEQVEQLGVDRDLLCTTRDEVSMTHTAIAGCDQCHEAIDGAGFNFENYDALGRFRSEENGCSVDATGNYPGTDIVGEVVDAVDLAGQLPGSTTVTRCASEHLFRYALGRKQQGRNDACEIASLATLLQSGNDSLQQLFVELVMTPSFRSRPQVK